MIQMEDKHLTDCGIVSPHLRTIVIALTGGSKCKYIVKWAMDKFLPIGKVSFKLLHVFPKICGVPTPMGNLIPLPQVRDDVAAAYKKEVEWQKTEMIIQYQKMLHLRKVPAEIVLVESDDITNAIDMVIAKHKAKDLVIGVSSNSLFSRTIKGRLLSSAISESAPSFCNVYVVSKGKLEFLRASSSETNGKEIEYDSSVCDSTNSSSRYTNRTFDPGSTSSESPLAFPTTQTKRPDRFFPAKDACKKLNQDLTEFPSRIINTRGLDDAWSFSTREPSLSRVTSNNTTTDTERWVPYRTYPQKFSSLPLETSSKRVNLATSSSEQVNIELEIEKLRTELRQLYGMQSMSQNEKSGANATQRQSDLKTLKQGEGVKPKEKIERSEELASLENGHAESAKRVANKSKEKEKLTNGLAERFTNITEKDVGRRGEDGHDDKEQVLNTLERLKDVADKIFVMASSTQIEMEPPSHFICPILQKVMDEPCVAADGYTYEKKAIEKWLKDNDTSPTTDFSLSNKNLITNYTLLYAIWDWKSKRSRQKPHAHSVPSHLR